MPSLYSLGVTITGMLPMSIMYPRCCYGLLAKEVGIVHGALACYLFDYDYPLCTGANSVVIGAAMGAGSPLNFFHLIAIGLHGFIAGLMRSCAGAALLTDGT